jgi:hypothetical protein
MFRFNEAIKRMSGLDRMKTRVSYLGYDAADGRNVTAKYKSFAAALKNSYQAEWITLNKDTEQEARWRCLINPSRLTEQFDKKVISIDFDSGVKEGTVFYWDRTDKYWMINLQQHTEEAYFRGIITRADYEVDVDGTTYRAILRGPIESTTEWKLKHNIAWNNLNYSLVLQVPKNSQTVNYFTRHRLVKIKLDYPNVDDETEILEEYHNWKVVATDKYSSDFLIDVYLDEWNDNAMEDASIHPDDDVIPDVGEPYIEGPRTVYGYDTNLLYSIQNLSNGKWLVSSNLVKINSSDENACELEILTGKAFKFNLTYKNDETELTEEITVKSF